MSIKGNFNVKKIEIEKDELREFEELVEKSGVGSHMVFRSKKSSDDDLFLDEL
jgi:hypothetical protein